MYLSLQNIDRALNGQLKLLVKTAAFEIERQRAADGQYHGSTHLDGSGIDFYIIGDDPIRQINIYHEVGHLLDNVPSLRDVFTKAVAGLDNPSWVNNGYIDGDALKFSRIPNDPNYTSLGPQAKQAYNEGPSEEWADAFANYVAGNIDTTNPKGMDMYNFVVSALAPYIGTR